MKLNINLLILIFISVSQLSQPFFLFFLTLKIFMFIFDNEKFIILIIIIDILIFYIRFILEFLKELLVSLALIKSEDFNLLSFLILNIFDALLAWENHLPTFFSALYNFNLQFFVYRSLTSFYDVWKIVLSIFILSLIWKRLCAGKSLDYLFI